MKLNVPGRTRGEFFLVVSDTSPSRAVPGTASGQRNGRRSGGRPRGMFWAPELWRILAESGLPNRRRTVRVGLQRAAPETWHVLRFGAPTPPHPLRTDRHNWTQNEKVSEEAVVTRPIRYAKPINLPAESNGWPEIGHLQRGLMDF